MAHESRSAKRLPLCWPAWIVLNERSSIVCTMTDVSQGGARLEMPGTAIVPDQFVMRFSMTSTAGRKCEVKWREPKAIGVQFVGVLK